MLSCSTAACCLPQNCRLSATNSPLSHTLPVQDPEVEFGSMFAATLTSNGWGAEGAKAGVSA